MRLRVIAGLLVLSPVLSAGIIHLKARDIDTSLPAIDETEPFDRLQPSRLHVMAEFARPWNRQTIAILESRGIRVVSVIGPTALTLNVPGKDSLAELGVNWWQPMRVHDKLSPELFKGSDSLIDALVAFHEDIPAADMDAIFHRSGIAIERVSGLLPNHRLVHAGLRLLERLAAWDEVAYIFPAPPKLAESGVRACGGALLQHLAVAQFVTEGPGWPVTSPSGLTLN